MNTHRPTARRRTSGLRTVRRRVALANDGVCNLPSQCQRPPRPIPDIATPRDFGETCFEVGPSSRYPGAAPSASATRRKVGRNGNDAGRCTTTRRTDRPHGHPVSATVPAVSRPELVRNWCAAASQAQLLHQHVGGGGQQHAELVGPEIAATGAVDLQLVQLLDPVLDFAALAVNLFVEPLRTLLQVGDDEARVIFRLSCPRRAPPRL